MLTRTVDEFLTWAFVHELCKGGGENGVAGIGSAWSAISQVATLGVRIAAPLRSSDFGAFLADDGPHPDAVIAGRAVAALGRIVLELPGDWGPVGDLYAAAPDILTHGEFDALVAASCERARDSLSRASMARHVVALVIARATIGSAPDWRIEPPDAVTETGADGRPSWFVRAVRTNPATGRDETVELFGYDASRRRPLPGAYRKFRLDPDPFAGIMARADYQIWRAAMDLVFADLAENVHGELIANRILPCAAPLAPWEGGTAPAAPRILLSA